MNVASMPLSAKLERVVREAAVLLPGDTGRRLLMLITPAALATMAVVTGVWAFAHFFGVGEIADVIILVVGVAAIGGSAAQAAEKLVGFAIGTYHAKSDADLHRAAVDLAAAISIIGVDVTLALLLHNRPKSVFRTSFNGKVKPYSEAFPQALPRNGRFRYKPSVKFDPTMDAGHGKTDWLGNSSIGIARDRSVMPDDEANKRIAMAITHERVHRILKPKLYLLRQVRMYAIRSAYKRSYILRYLEEAFAEGLSTAKHVGISKEEFLRVKNFPFDRRYEITKEDLRTEGKGILLGPVVVGGATYNLYYGHIR